MAEDDSVGKFSELLNDRIFWIKKKSRLTAIAGAIISVFFSLGYLVAFIWGAFKISKGLITFGTMTIFLSLASRIQGPIYSIARTIPQLSTIEASADRINELRKLPVESQNCEVPLADIVDVGIEFQNVAFGYTEDVVLDNIKLKMDVGNVPLDINTAVPLGLIVNELVSNSLKHAFPHGEDGEISVKFHKANDHYVFQVADTGVGFPEGLDFRKTNSLGMRLVDTLTDQVDGEMELDTNHGTTFTLTFAEEDYGSPLKGDEK